MENSLFYINFQYLFNFHYILSMTIKDYKDICPKRIDLIIKNYDKKELVPSARAWEMWQSSFFNKLPIIKLVEGINNLKKFELSGDFSESSFKFFFKDLNYSIQYINPIEFNSFTISQKEKQRIAFLLQDELPLSWEKLNLLVRYLYRESQDQWNFETLRKLSGCVCENLSSALLLNKYIDERNIVPEKKVS